MSAKQKKGMVDVSLKDRTKRVAVASSTVKMSKKVFDNYLKVGSPKGSVLETAKVSGILAAKQTPYLIAMCHPLELNQVTMDFKIDKAKRTIEVICEVSYMGKTGVEMEALVACSTAALTIYDMMKWAGKDTVISQTKLKHKSGGKSGDYHRK